MSGHISAGTSSGKTELERSIDELGSKDGMVRRHAREVLEKVGTAATPYLIEALKRQNVNIRWEAAKALKHIADPRAGFALVEALIDESFEVQWLAAEALIALNGDALIPLLRGLIRNYGSLDMRRGAHHVLHYLERKELLAKPALYVLDELRSIEPLEPYPVSIKRALDKLIKSRRSAQLPTIN